MKEIDKYMTVNEAAYRYEISVNTVKEKLKPSRYSEQIERMVDDGLIKYFVEPGKKNRSWIISIDAMEEWFPEKEIKNL